MLSNDTVFFDNFENGSKSEWSNGKINADHLTSFSNFSGRFGNLSQTLTLDTTPGEAYTLEFDLYTIDSWDGDTTVNSSGNVIGPDYFTIDIAGVEVFRETFSSSGSPSNQSFRAADERGHFGFNSKWEDTIYRDIRLTFTATGASTEIQFAKQTASAPARITLPYIW